LDLGSTLSARHLAVLVAALSGSACLPVNEVRLDPELLPGARSVLLITGFPNPSGWATDLPVSQAVPVGVRGSDVELRYFRRTLAELGLPRGAVALQSDDSGCLLFPADARFRLEGDRFVPAEGNETPLHLADASTWPKIQAGPPLLAATCAPYSCLPRLSQHGCQVEITPSEVDCPLETTIKGRVDSAGQLHLSPPPNYQQCVEVPADAYSAGGMRCAVGVYGDCVVEAFHAAPPPLNASVTVTEPLFPVGEISTYSFRPPIFTAINDLAFSHDYLFASAQSAFDNGDCCISDGLGGCQAVDYALARLDPATMQVEKFPGPCVTLLIADPQGDGVLAGQVRERKVVRLSADGRITASSPPLWPSAVSTQQNIFSAFGLSRDRETLFVATVNLDPALPSGPVAQILGLDTVSLTVTASSSLLGATHLISLDQLPDGRLISVDEKLDAFVRFEVHGTAPARTIITQHQAYVGMDLHFTDAHLLPASSEPGAPPWLVALETGLNRVVLARADVVAVPGRVETLNLAPYETRGSPQSAVALPTGELLISLVPPLLESGVSSPGDGGFVRLSPGAQPRILPGVLPFVPLDHPIQQIGRLVAAPDGTVFGLLPTSGRIFRLKLH